jgi:hypothetical protein
MVLLVCSSTQPVRHRAGRFSTVLAPARMQASLWGSPRVKQTLAKVLAAQWLGYGM